MSLLSHKQKWATDIPSEFSVLMTHSPKVRVLFWQAINISVRVQTNVCFKLNILYWFAVCTHLEYLLSLEDSDLTFVSFSNFFFEIKTPVIHHFNFLFFISSYRSSVFSLYTQLAIYAFLHSKFYKFSIVSKWESMAI